jgi:hypothetical protein
MKAKTSIDKYVLKNKDVARSGLRIRQQNIII